MNIINERTEPAIIDFEIPSLSKIDFDKLYSYPPIEQKYNTLYVNPGRYDLPYHTPEHIELCHFLERDLYDIFKKLMEMDQFRWPILDTGFQNFDCFYRTKVKKDQGLYLSVMIYKPGFSMPWHLDNRFAVLNGIINVNDHETQTCFSTTGQGWNQDTQCPLNEHMIIHRGTKKKFQGTAWTNNELAWHCVPKVPIERKVILFGVNLR